MFSPARKLILAAMLLGVLFAVGLTQLFLLRFKAGDVYPPYSSLRSDPLGTQALFESLDRISGTPVERNFRPLHQFKFDAQTTLLIIGLADHAVFRPGQNLAKLLDALKQSGGRLVLTFAASQRHRSDRSKDDGSAEDDGSVRDKLSKRLRPEEDDNATSPCDPLDTLPTMKAMGFAIKMAGEKPMEEMAVRVADGLGILPATLAWRSPLYFELQDGDWSTLYSWQDQPVMARRPMGRGTLVIAADSYLISNEALRNQRASGLLTWFVVPGNDIVVDESLKGLVKQPGVAALTRQYRLHGVVAALLVIAMLFIWRQSAVFVPAVKSRQSSHETPPAAGRDTSQGLVHLARQHIGSDELLPLCYRTWKTHAVRRVSPTRMADVKALALKAAAQPKEAIQVRIYQQICELLKQGRHS